jgi:hypothetical protein
VRPWQFSKPKTPGFGISSNFYLSVLSSRATMPSIASVINPSGEAGAAIGFGAPLSGPTDKARLNAPLSRGAYAVASKDRKTVLKMLVLSKEEAGYDPNAFALSPLATNADPELIARMRGTWSLAQLTFESHDAMVYPALDFLLGVCVRLAVLSDGVIADPISFRYLLPDEVFHRDRIDARIDARDHVIVEFRQKPDGLQAFTLGMQKFALPEYEIMGLLDTDRSAATRFLLLICQSVLLGDLTQTGTRYGDPKLSFEARQGGFDRGQWEGIQVLELLPPTSYTATEALRAWERSLP